MASPKNVRRQQYVGVIYDIFGILPVVCYACYVRRDEDCLNCFNRHQTINFSRYQVRKNNNIESECLKTTAQLVLSHTKSTSGYAALYSQDGRASFEQIESGRVSANTFRNPSLISDQDCMAQPVFGLTHAQTLRQQ
jgi:hypothetical protein